MLDRENTASWCQNMRSVLLNGASLVSCQVESQVRHGVGTAWVPIVFPINRSSRTTGSADSACRTGYSYFLRSSSTLKSSMFNQNGYFELCPMGGHRQFIECQRIFFVQARLPHPILQTIQSCSIAHTDCSSQHLDPVPPACTEQQRA